MRLLLALLMFASVGCATVEKVEKAVDKGLADASRAVESAGEAVRTAKEIKETVASVPENIRRSFDATVITDRKATDRTVVEGDTLWDLAYKEYDDPFLWPSIYRANRDQITNPHRIEIGQVLAVPNYLTLRDMEVFRERAFSEPAR